VEAVLAGLTWFVRKVSVNGANKPGNTRGQRSRSGVTNSRLRVADSTFGLIFKVGRDIPFEQFEPVHDVALQGE